MRFGKVRLILKRQWHALRNKNPGTPKSIKEDDPSVLAEQNLAEVDMLEKVRDFYCAPGTPEYDNFFTADNIAEVMMLEYEGTPEGQTAPLLIGCKTCELLYDPYKTSSLPVFTRPLFGLLKVNYNSRARLYIDDTAPLVYFKGCGY